MNRCKNCKKETKNKSYCSVECRNKGYEGKKRAEYVTVRCQSCEKEFEAKKQLVDSGKKYCSVECQYKGYRVQKNERIKLNCLFCDSEFEDLKRLGKKEGIQKKYCSRKCKDTHQKELYQGEGNPVYGQEHSEEWKKWQSERVTKMWESEEHRDKVQKGQERFREESGHWFGRSEGSNENRKETYLEQYGVDHNWKVKEIRKKCDTTCFERHGLIGIEIAHKELLRKKETKIETKIKNILIDNEIKFKKNFCISFDGKKRMFDFYLKEYNLLIEADGDYWHSNPTTFKELNETQKKNKLNDDFKNYIAKELGYNLIRFWEMDINKSEFENVFLKEIKNGK